MLFRVSHPDDVSAVAELYAAAKETMRAMGLEQWKGDGYPNAGNARADAETCFGRVAEENGVLYLTYAFVPTGEPDYDVIRAGAWLTGDMPHTAATYAAVHRVTIRPDRRGTGLSGRMIGVIMEEAAARGFLSVRIDTHPDNVPMRKMLEKNGFTHCGTITLSSDGTDRVAYERLTGVSPAKAIDLSSAEPVDLSQEMFTSEVYPGDPKPEKQTVKSMPAGDLYNLTYLTQCAHNGTHLDAPRHFIDGGRTIDQLPLSLLVGEAFVLDCPDGFTRADAARIPAGCVRLLLRGGLPDMDGSRAIVAAGVKLVGVEAQSVGDMHVHRLLLGADLAVLEGIRLSAVTEGRCCLFAAPINYGGIEGAPTRAVLLRAKN